MGRFICRRSSLTDSAEMPGSGSGPDSTGGCHVHQYQRELHLPVHRALVPGLSSSHLNFLAELLAEQAGRPAADGASPQPPGRRCGRRATGTSGRARAGDGASSCARRPPRGDHDLGRPAADGGDRRRRTAPDAQSERSSATANTPGHPKHRTLNNNLVEGRHASGHLRRQAGGDGPDPQPSVVAQRTGARSGSGAGGRDGSGAHPSRGGGGGLPSARPPGPLDRADPAGAAANF